MTELSRKKSEGEEHSPDPLDHLDIHFLVSRNNSASGSVETDTEYFRFFNSRNAKSVAGIIVFFVFLYHAIVRISYGKERVKKEERSMWCVIKV